jgi:cobalt-precorrin-5B (C1)-methyltransferase
VKKDAGDDPDVTDGLQIYSEVRFTDTECISVKGGGGVGTVTKPGLQIPVGEPAINPVPLRMIREAVSPFFRKGIQVTISVPNGEKVAKHTFNEKLGILGGISILGTTGIVKPFSVSALKESIALEIDVTSAAGIDTLFLVPGNIGRAAVTRHFTVRGDAVVMMSNYIGEALAHASGRFYRVVLAGHPGKLAKVLNGDYNTHSKNSRSALPLVKRRVIACALGTEIDGRVEQSTTVEGVVQCLSKRMRNGIFDVLATEIETETFRFMEERTPIGVLLVDMKKDIIGKGDILKNWEHEGWLT